MAAARDRSTAPGPAGPRWSRWVGRFLARVVWNTTVTGWENVPRTGPVVLAANHTGMIDGPLVHGAARRGTHFLVKTELFREPLGTILRWAGQIPVDRDNGRPALVSALGVLRRGGVVGVFPEGNRGRGAVTSAKAGVAWLAVNAQAPVVPVVVLGTRRTGERLNVIPGLRRHLAVHFCAPIAPVTAGSRRESIDATLALVRDTLAVEVEVISAATGMALPADGPAVRSGSSSSP